MSVCAKCFEKMLNTRTTRTIFQSEHCQDCGKEMKTKASVEGLARKRAADRKAASKITDVKEFRDVLIDCNIKYVAKKRKYDETWRTMPMYDLHRRLAEEIHELQYARTNDGEYKRLINVINVALMVAARRREEDGR